jgi:hypothetical protein
LFPSHIWPHHAANTSRNLRHLLQFALFHESTNLIRDGLTIQRGNAYQFFTKKQCYFLNGSGHLCRPVISGSGILQRSQLGHLGPDDEIHKFAHNVVNKYVCPQLCPHLITGR